MTREHFSPHLGTSFEVIGTEPPFALFLAEIIPLKHHNPALRAPFSLLFRSADVRALEQATHRFRHDEIGEVEIFVTPIARAAGGTAYEAVFN